ncbi:TPR repeat-containing protein YfgC precursor [Anatilimnocola aggregata]|uniref:TPR repeat-containing protein YfgC n=1 Tax=Anatilimnocola aggregata TaxID=2528021 RepID=A0A517YJG9_9BACT|nr:M48 family metallopeptidase [Anatilimnocola aggregata]QDU30370.1 TPR repeat-containing protein YfgC precursor [Anatilimnocola aggregata]
MSAGYNDGGMQRRRPFAIKLAPILIGLVAVGWMALRGCQQGPFGRQQIVAMNAQEEKALGLQAFEETLSDARVIRMGMEVAEVKDVAQRLVAATQNPAFLASTQQAAQQMDWAVEVVDSKEVNAFCLPGGKMVVYTGILPVAETEAGLATVLGHEIAHALAHHGAERMAKSKMAEILLNSANSSLSEMDPAQRETILKTLNAGAKYGILKYSRDHESEADHMGLLLMAAAGFDPQESIHFWERMQQATAGGQRPAEFASTHPSHETRISDLREWMPEAMKLYQARK